MQAVGFSIGVASQVTGLTARQIRLLVSGGVVAPSVHAPRVAGDGARFSYFDLMRLKVAAVLRSGGEVAAARLAPAMVELTKVRDGGWDGCLLYTTDWVTFSLTRDAAELAANVAASPVTVVVSLDAVHRELQAAMSDLAMAAPAA